MHITLFKFIWQITNLYAMMTLISHPIVFFIEYNLEVQVLKCVWFFVLIIRLRIIAINHVVFMTSIEMEHQSLLKYKELKQTTLQPDTIKE